MTAEHHNALFRALRGPGKERDPVVRRLLDDMTAEDCMKLGPVIFDIEQQARNAERFQCLLELTWVLKQANGSYAEVVH